MRERKSNRLKGYDYSGSGYYFVTICPPKKEKRGLEKRSRKIDSIQKSSHDYYDEIIKGKPMSESRMRR